MTFIYIQGLFFSLIVALFYFIAQHICFNLLHNQHISSSKLEIHKNSLSRSGVKLWNEMPCHIRDLPKKKFRKVLHRLLSDILKREDDYIETPLIVEKVRLIV